MRYSILFIFLILFSFSLVTSLPDDANTRIDFSYPTSVNYSTINVNNSQYLQGYTPTTLKNWIQGLFDSIYCKLTGCSMTGNLVTTANVTANYFIGNGSLLTGISTGATLQSYSFTLTSPSGQSNASLIRVPYNISISAVHILCDGGTNITGMVNVYNSDGRTNKSISADVTALNNTEYTAIFSPEKEINVSQNIGWHTTEVNGYPTRVLISVDYMRR